MIYIFAIGLFLNLGILASWLFISDWKFNIDDCAIIGITSFNSFGFAIAIGISM